MITTSLSSSWRIIAPFYSVAACCVRLLILQMVVREEGFEPPRACARQVLSLLRLPVPPFPQSLAMEVYHGVERRMSLFVSGGGYRGKKWRRLAASILTDWLP